MLKLTVSTTSTNASFFLYFTSARRQLVTPVAWLVILEDSSLLEHMLAAVRQEDGGTHSDNLRGHDTLRRNVTLKRINLAVLGIAKVVCFCNNSVKVRGGQEKRTVNQLIDQHKVILHTLFVYFPKVRFTY